MTTAVSVVVVNYRTAALTEKAVRSALAKAVTDVVVVDNASKDDVDLRLASIQDERVRLISNDRNVGFGSAANLAATRCEGDVVVFLNSDATVESGAVDELAAEVRRFSGRALTGPLVLDPSGTTQRSVGLLPRPVDLVIRALGLHHVAKGLSGAPLLGRLIRSSSIGREYDTAARRVGAEVTMVSGACFAVDRRRFLELGGFDERYFMYFEDADLCRRAKADGWRIRFVPEAVVHHLVSGSTGRDYHFGPLHGPSMVVYLDRWYGTAGASLAILLLLARAIGSSLAGGERGRDARTALRLGVRAYRDGRSTSPMPASMPIP